MTEPKFCKITSIDPVVDKLANTIIDKLDAGQRVLWLVSGGSSIKVAAAVGKRLQGTPLSNLIITLADERYGDVGSINSNWLQLTSQGFDMPGALLQPVLVGLDLFATAENFSRFLKDDFVVAQYKIGLFGIGADGHTAGILPKTSAARSNDLTVAYDGGTYERVTITPKTIAQLDEVVAYAVGQDKWPILDQLSTDMSILDQPAQAFKQVPRITVYNDYKGEEI